MNEIGYVRNEYDTLQIRQLKIRKSMLEEKMERTIVGETLVINKEVDFLKLEEAIVEAKHEIIVLEEEKSIHK